MNEPERNICTIYVRLASVYFVFFYLGMKQLSENTMSQLTQDTKVLMKLRRNVSKKRFCLKTQNSLPMMSLYFTASVPR